METQNELFPLPKKQASLFGHAKGTVLWESPAKVAPLSLKPSENRKRRSPSSENESRHVKTNRGQTVCLLPRHRCDPKNLLPQRWNRDNSGLEQMLKELDDDSDAFIPQDVEQQWEDEPSIIDEIEPPPIIEDLESIEVLGPVAHVDPTHPNPYDHTQSLWQSIRQFLERKFGV